MHRIRRALCMPSICFGSRRLDSRQSATVRELRCCAWSKYLCKTSRPYHSQPKPKEQPFYHKSLNVPRPCWKSHDIWAWFNTSFPIIARPFSTKLSFILQLEGYGDTLAAKLAKHSHGFAAKLPVGMIIHVCGIHISSSNVKVKVEVGRKVSK